MAIEALTAAHDTAEFDCGNASLNTYLKDRALRHSKQDISRSYVLIEQGRILGYHTIATGSVDSEHVPRSVPREYPVPVVVLARLATIREVQRGGGFGRELLIDALRKANEVSKIAGAYAVVLDALNENAKRFYLKYGFTELLDDPFHLHLLMKNIRQLPGI